MARLSWTPWHQVVRLREDVRSGDLPLAAFAADLHDVALGRGRAIYRDAAEFFALTYPTHNLRELAKDVVLRLAGRSEKAIRQLELTYGGGKAHTLITLLHLVRDPEQLPSLPAVDEFKAHIGVGLPRARPAKSSSRRSAGRARDRAGGEPARGAVGPPRAGRARNAGADR